MGIQILAADVVDKIAAGEVLERPANLIKELVENSIDAGATEIEVEFDQGGREVVVRDNGGGIARGDLALALQRHATSKITVSEDLYRLNSFGFRGEALASIAAVSRLTLTSRPRGSEQGYRLDSEFGGISDPLPVAAREGTEVRVRELFANVPARLRFMKSEAAEHTAIKTALKAMALANEKVSFRILSKGELQAHWPAADVKARALAVLQNKELYAGELNVDGVHAEVLVSSPQDTLNVNRGMWFFVQGRWVQDRSLSAAVMEAYRNLLMHGEYPSVVVRLRLAPEEVDVNVHPTKAQVKFREPQAAFRATCRSIRAVLEQAPWLGPASVSTAATTLAAPQSALGVEADEPTSLRFRAPEFERTQYSTKAFPLAQVREAVRAAEISVVDAFQESPREAFRWGDLQVVGQVQQTYVVAQDVGAMYLIDQHAAHERVMFERLMHAFKNGRMDVQNLLLPLVFDFTAEEVEALHSRRQDIERLGLSVERMGPESIAVQAMPALISEAAVATSLRRLAFELVQNAESLALEAAVGEIFASMACHSVIRAGQSQSHEQMSHLLQQMDEFPLSSFCPHGRPVFIKRRFSDLEREFGRIV